MAIRRKFPARQQKQRILSHPEQLTSGTSLRDGRRFIHLLWKRLIFRNSSPALHPEAPIPQEAEHLTEGKNAYDATWLCQWDLFTDAASKALHTKLFANPACGSCVNWMFFLPLEVNTRRLHIQCLLTDHSSFMKLSIGHFAEEIRRTYRQTSHLVHTRNFFQNARRSVNPPRVNLVFTGRI